MAPSRLSLPNTLDFLITPDCEAEKYRIADNCHTDSPPPVGGLVEHRGFEPLTPTLPVLCAPNCANAP